MSKRNLVFSTPEQIADGMQEWFDHEAADGYNLLFPYYPTLFEDFVQLVIPVLQKRGIFREDYEGTTLREHLGLQVPPFEQ